MEKFIEVRDGLVPEYLQDYVDSLIHNKSNNGDMFPLAFLKSVTNKDKSNNTDDIGFSHQFRRTFGDYQNNFAFPFYQILYNLLANENIVLEDVIMGRVFLQTPTINYGPQNPHNDTEVPHWVCLYYVNDSDGDTIFYEDDGVTEIKRVSPKKGRIAFFEGSIKHSGSKPKTNTRTVVNICFRGIKYNKN